MTAMPPAGTIAIDVGGTFTDITFADAATGATWVAKTPSTPGDLSGGFITAIRKVLAQAGRTSTDILRVFHGTTTATNAILEGRTPPIALVTTAGFKYVLEIGRHDIPRHGNLYGWSKPARPITPDRVFEVTERSTPTAPSSRRSTRTKPARVARQLAQLGVPAVAVVFLHAYANRGPRGAHAGHPGRGVSRACSCRCPPRCCRSSASSSGAWPPRSTPR